MNIRQIKMEKKQNKNRNKSRVHKSERKKVYRNNELRLTVEIGVT